MKIRTLFLLGSIVLTVLAIAHAEFVTHTFDTAGRLTSANYGSGKSVSYQYDVSGNLTRSTDNVVTDSDNDGMTDSWENSFFGSLDRDGSGDFDGDGMSDLQEFFAATDPKNANSLLRLSSTVTNTIVQTTVSWVSVSGKTYRVQYKNSLNDPGWNDVPGDVLATGMTASKTDTSSVGQPQRFYRVQVLP